MHFSFCYKKRIRHRVESLFADIYDFCEASRFCNLTMKRHPKLYIQFEDNYLNVDTFFNGATFKNENIVWQVYSDIKFARDIITRDNIHIGLIPFLEMMIHDLEELLKHGYDAVL